MNQNYLITKSLDFDLHYAASNVHLYRCSDHNSTGESSPIEAYMRSSYTSPNEFVVLFSMSGRQDLNLRPLDPQPSALPD